VFTCDSQTLRLAEVSIDPAWRHPRAGAAIDPIAADELFAGYLEELLDEESTAHIRSSATPKSASSAAAPDSCRFLLDDILRLAVPAGEVVPLG
jgi:hypothetical protein